MELPRSAYPFLGLPEYYYGLDYKDTKLVPTKVQPLIDSINRAPEAGVLLVSGCSAPIVNQLIKGGRKAVGLSFPEYYSSTFLKNEDAMELPNASVVLVHSIGSEAANNMAYSGKLLGNILSYYKSRTTLVILETNLTLSNFQTTYSMSIKNTVTLQLREEDSWL